MADAPAHTPYDGSSKPFGIGLKPLDPNYWIEADQHLEHYLCEKDRLYDADPGAVFCALPDTDDATKEVLDRLVTHLAGNHQMSHRIDGTHVHIGNSGRVVNIADDTVPILWRAARLVQEDLCLMRRHVDSWRLAAAALAFPSSWKLADKIGRPMADIHAPVPGFAGRMAQIIERIFDNLDDAQPVVRFNWSIYDNEALFHPEPHEGRSWRTGEALDPDQVFLRIERQTLTKLPMSGDILFTIRIHVDPISSLKGRKDREMLCQSMGKELMALDPDQLSYKAMQRHREMLTDLLGRLARAS